MDVFVYEMKYDKNMVADVKIECIPFQSEYFNLYKKIYNECFYEMRKALGIEPYDFLRQYDQIEDKAKDVYLLIDGNEMIGAVACYGNEIDDLVVNKKYQRQGYGEQLLHWGMSHIREKNEESITLHVAEWNQNAIALYKKTGFEVSQVLKVR